MKKSLLCSISLLAPLSALHAGLPPGNGMIIDSAATSYYNHTQNPALPSVQNDLKNYPGAKIQYMFPDIGYINIATSSDIISTKNLTASTTVKVYGELPCNQKPPVAADNSNTVIFFYSFCANPSIARPNADAGFKFAQPDLGVPVALTDIIKDDQPYSVAPMITYDGDWTTDIQALYAAQPATIKNAMQTLSGEIATSISATNAIGVAFDNEPSIGKTDTTNGLNSAIETNFFDTIAQALSKKNQYLFLYDANTTAQTLYATDKNIVDLYSLYDIEGADADIAPAGSSTAYYPVGNYTNTSGTNDAPSVYNAVKNGLALGIPIMFVAPASATATLWANAQTYNVVPSSRGTSPAQCNQTFDTSDVERNVLSQYLCNSKTCTPPGGLDALNSYLGPANCAAYPNPGAQDMSSYFNAALIAISTAKENTSGIYPSFSPYLGIVLYTWRLPKYADFSCAGHYYSQYNDTFTLKECDQVLPSEISNSVWSGFAGWTP